MKKRFFILFLGFLALGQDAFCMVPQRERRDLLIEGEGILLNKFYLGRRNRNHVIQRAISNDQIKKRNWHLRNLRQNFLDTGYHELLTLYLFRLENEVSRAGLIYKAGILPVPDIRKGETERSRKFIARKEKWLRGKREILFLPKGRITLKSRIFKLINDKEAEYIEMRRRDEISDDQIQLILNPGMSMVDQALEIENLRAEDLRIGDIYECKNLQRFLGFDNEIVNRDRIILKKVANGKIIMRLNFKRQTEDSCGHFAMASTQVLLMSPSLVIACAVLNTDAFVDQIVKYSQYLIKEYRTMKNKDHGNGNWVDDEEMPFLNDDEMSVGPVYGTGGKFLSIMQLKTKRGLEEEYEAYNQSTENLDIDKEYKEFIERQGPHGHSIERTYTVDRFNRTGRTEGLVVVLEGRAHWISQVVETLRNGYVGMIKTDSYWHYYQTKEEGRWIGNRFKYDFFAHEGIDQDDLNLINVFDVKMPRSPARPPRVQRPRRRPPARPRVQSRPPERPSKVGRKKVKKAARPPARPGRTYQRRLQKPETAQKIVRVKKPRRPKRPTRPAKKAPRTGQVSKLKEMFERGLAQ